MHPIFFLFDFSAKSVYVYIIKNKGKVKSINTVFSRVFVGRVYLFVTFSVLYLCIDAVSRMLIYQSFKNIFES